MGTRTREKERERQRQGGVNGKGRDFGVVDRFWEFDIFYLLVHMRAFGIEIMSVAQGPGTRFRKSTSFPKKNKQKNAGINSSKMGECLDRMDALWGVLLVRWPNEALSKFRGSALS